MHAELPYKACYEQSLDGILIITSDGSIVNANAVACKMLGTMEDEICKFNISDLTNTKEPNFKKLITVRNQTGKAKGQLTFNCKDGNRILCEISTFIFQNSADEKQSTIIFRDITANHLTEQKAAEAESKYKNLLAYQSNLAAGIESNNEERYRVMVENSYDAILLLDENLTTIYRSPSTEQVMGFKDEERLGKSYLELTHPNDLEKVKGLQQIVVNNPGISIPITVRARHSNGHYLWFNGVATNLLHKKSVKAIVVNLRDMTERKKAGDALQELSDKLLLATRAANMCIWDWDIGKDILTLDAAMYHLFGIDSSETEIKFERWYSCIHPDDVKKQHEEIDAAIKGSHDFDTEFKIVMPNKSIRYIRSIALIERDETGKALRMIGNNWDISELKLAIIEKEKIMNELVRRNNELEDFTYALSHNLRAPVANIKGLSSLLLDLEDDEDAALAIKKGLCQSIKKVDEVIIEMNSVLQGRQQSL